MQKLITFLIVSLVTITAFGQVDPTIWDNLKKVTSDNYEFQVPSNWRQISVREQGPEQLLEASGFGLPLSYNGSPVIVTAFFVKQDGKNLEDCKATCLKGYRENPDREFPMQFTEGQEKIKLLSGQDAYLLNTRFLRKSKGFNQSRFDLVVYSNKAQSGYIYTLSIQYLDGDYKFETDNALADFAKKLYSYLKIKK